MNGDSQAALKWALAAVERRDLLSTEIEERLRAKGFSDEAILAVLDTLQSIKFLDDENVQERIAEMKTRSRTVGRDKARAQLEARGIDPSTAETLVEAFLPEEEERARALSLLQKRFEPSEKVDRAARYLASRGFSTDTIEFALEQYFQI